MTDDLHTTLRAAVQARLALARAATPGPWTTPYREHDVGWLVHNARGTEYAMTIAVMHSVDSEADAKHIAANDPGTVIRGCERDLRVLERHRSVDGMGKYRDVGEYCDQCSRLSQIGEMYPCPDVLDMAQAYNVSVDDAGRLTRWRHEAGLDDER